MPPAPRFNPRPISDLSLSFHVAPFLPSAPLPGSGLCESPDAESPFPGAEEFALHDQEGFGSVSFSEYEDIEAVSALAELIAEFGEMVASTVWVHVSGKAVEAQRLLEDCYQGSWDSLEAWAEELLSSSGELDQVPENLRPYIDIEAYARDLELNGDVFTIEDGISVHVFWGR